MPLMEALTHGSPGSARPRFSLPQRQPQGLHGRFSPDSHLLSVGPKLRGKFILKLFTKGGFLKTGGLGGAEAPPGFPAVSAWVLSTLCVSCAPAGLCGSLTCPWRAPGSRPPRGPVAGGPASLLALGKAVLCWVSLLRSLCSSALPCRFAVSECPVSVCSGGVPTGAGSCRPRASARRAGSAGKATAFTRALGQLLGGNLVASFPLDSATTSCASPRKPQT